MCSVVGYSVKEIFVTLQGEGAHVGRVAVFCRFTGCNLWSGREQHRGKGKGGCAAWCDTDFVGMDGIGGGHFLSPEELAQACLGAWKENTNASESPFIVCTGGEPLLQLDSKLIDALHQAGFEIAIETNGTIDIPKDVDWVCVSPKSGTELRAVQGDELKLVYPQEGLTPELFVSLAFKHHFLQPKDGPDKEKDLQMTIAYCLLHPKWRLSLQTHKTIGIP